MNNEFAKKLTERTKLFSIEVLTLCENMPQNRASDIIARQLIRSATSVGANYRAVCRARSDKEFVAKLNIVLEESDECIYWLELIEAKKWIDVAGLIKETNELTAIFVSSLKTINSRMKKS